MENTNSRTVYRIVTLSYFCLLFYLVLFTSERLNREPGIAHISGQFSLIDKCNLLLMEPFGQNGSPYNPFVDVIGNILIFVPIPFLGKKAVGFPRSFVEALLLVLTISLLIEALQFLFNLGVSDPDDVILNALGGIFGYLLFGEKTKKKIVY